MDSAWTRRQERRRQSNEGSVAMAHAQAQLQASDDDDDDVRYGVDDEVSRLLGGGKPNIQGGDGVVDTSFAKSSLGNLSACEGR